MKIDDATFVVTDTETTGTKASTNRVIELGAVKIRGGEIVDRFQQLVNPERSIPSRITQITGISTGMVFDAPTMDTVMPEYLDFLGDGIFAAHNLPFDERFVNAELKRLSRPTLSNQTLCTLRLARRLLPGLRSKGLTRLAQFYGVNVNGRHRALGDAEATGVILKRFFAQLDFEHAIDTVEELLAFQHKRYKKVRSEPKHLATIRKEILPDLPDAPGVYFLKSQKGKILYIGKAKQLSDRVRSYFNAIESHSARKRKMMNKVRSVDWKTTQTELEALLLESRLIKEHKPYYNRAQRRYYSRPFLRLDVDEDFPRLGWTKTIQDDGAEYYGPLRNRDQAEAMVELVGKFFHLRECDDTRFNKGETCLYADMHRCPVAPCVTGDADRYADTVTDVQRFLTGQDRSVLDALTARMQQASEQLDFEKAAEFRDWHDQVERLLETQSAVAAPIRQHHAAVLHPHDDGTVDVLLVRFGQFVASITLEAAPGDGSDGMEGAQHRILTDRIRSDFRPDGDRPETLSVRDVDEIRLLLHWMYVHRDDIRMVRWDEDTSAHAFARHILRTIDAEE